MLGNNYCPRCMQHRCFTLVAGKQPHLPAQEEWLKPLASERCSLPAAPRDAEGCGVQWRETGTALGCINQRERKFLNVDSSRANLCDSKSPEGLQVGKGPCLSDR